jgi:uncharacterized membrane protein YfcA
MYGSMLTYWLEYWWVFPIALGICVLVCLVGVEGSIMFIPFYAVIFPWLAGEPLTALEAIQIGIITEIFGFSSSFVGFYRHGLIDFRLGLRATTVGIPLALAGVVLAYRVPQAVLLVVVALVLPPLAWYLQRPVHSEPVDRPPDPLPAHEEDVADAAARIPLCCYASGKLYTGHDPSSLAATVSAPPVPPDASYAHHDRHGRSYTYSYRGHTDQLLVGSVGGFFTGLLGFGVGVLGVAHLVIRRIPIRIAVGTSHFVILLVTGAAVAAHLVEIVAADLSPRWNIIFMNVIAVLIGGQLAAWLAGRLPEHKTRRVLVVLLLALSAVTLYRALVSFV